MVDAQSEPEGPPVQNGSRLQLAHVDLRAFTLITTPPSGVAARPGAGQLLALSGTDRPTPTAPTGMTFGGRQGNRQPRAGELWQGDRSVLRKLVSRNAPFDRYVAGDGDAISNDAKQGLKLFIGKAGLHQLPQHAAAFRRRFTRHRAEDRHGGLPHADLVKSRLQSGSDLRPGCRGRRLQRQRTFQRRPSYAPRRQLLQPEDSAGALADERPAAGGGDGTVLPRRAGGDTRRRIEFYDRGGDPAGSFLGGPKEIRALHLSHTEKAQLKAFLHTLTGDPVPAQYLRDLHNQ